MEKIDLKFLRKEEEGGKLVEIKNIKEVLENKIECIYFYTDDKKN
jgi:hypothetical protein